MYIMENLANLPAVGPYPSSGVQFSVAHVRQGFIYLSAVPPMGAMAEGVRRNGAQRRGMGPGRSPGGRIVWGSSDREPARAAALAAESWEHDAI